MPAIPCLSWIETGRANSPLATYSADFGAGSEWVFNLAGSYQNRAIAPVGANIDNSDNKTEVTVSYGPVVSVVSAFERGAVRIPAGTAALTIRCAVAQTVQITFFVDQSAASESLSQNTFAIQTQVQQAIAAATLGTMQPIINSDFSVPLEFAASVTSNGAGIYVMEGWQLYALPGFASAATSAGPLSTSRTGARFGRIFGAGPGGVQLGSAIPTADSAQFIGAPVSLGFDVSFGANFAGNTLLVDVYAAPSIDAPAMPFMPGQSSVLSGTVAYDATAKRVTFTGSTAITPLQTQLAVVFTYAGAGIAGAAETVTVSRVQVDSGQPQSYRPVPGEIERRRCLAWRETLNADAQTNATFAMGMATSATQAIFALPYCRKHKTPSIAFVGTVHVFTAAPSFVPVTLSGVFAGLENSQIVVNAPGGSFVAGQPVLLCTTAGGGIDIVARM